ERERNILDALHRGEIALADYGHDRAEDREREQWKLLDDERAQSPSRQRPEVEKEKYEWKCDVHLLRHEAERHRDEDAPPPRRSGCVEKDREHREECAERVFALRHPRD